ncbi:hypothetical protein COU96_01285 [Candidatus Shapirobacteria bacterium CG10_big_fil_rev_8_21_14_0_10_38_14]|uniref:DUF5678 domain-containing protein n=1 Tax=Candidatus Shapirobacteria bacterium CG10_big_fil_rev_8_21_14_0_10_38_14 TaxID=1974483 RepID=A0A2M8L5R6_9BACT|nr:MAG: hypothetical protein COU96_01285 [Candidatus Shapirobacteria bacterium CG10_big_fil_rev_8_21_14_0_10_38_14]
MTKAKATTFSASAEEIIQKGQKFYEEKLKNKLEKKFAGKFVAIEINSGEYFIGNTLEKALEKARRKFPYEVFHSVKIGSPGVFTTSNINKNDGHGWLF